MASVPCPTQITLVLLSKTCIPLSYQSDPKALDEEKLQTDTCPSLFICVSQVSLGLVPGMLPWAVSWAQEVCLNAPEGSMHRRRAAKVISPSPLLLFWRKEPPGPCHVPREPPELEKRGQGVYLQVEIVIQYIAWKCYQRTLRGTKNPWLCPKKAQSHLCYTVLGITKVSRRLGGNQLPFPFTHLFENPLFTALHLTVESSICKVSSTGLGILIFSSS